jgi:hypothetical protein
MKVRELIALLRQMDPEWTVIQSQDPEGNHFAKTWNVEHARYHNHQTYIPVLTEELKRMGYSEDDLAPPGVAEDAAVLWPE